MPTDDDFQRLNQRINKLEELMAHQDHTIQQLDEVVRAVNIGMEEMRRKMQADLDRLKWQMSNQSGDDLPHEKQPHY